MIQALYQPADAFQENRLFDAWEHVAAHARAPGVDGKRVEDLAPHIHPLLRNWRRGLLDGTFRPDPVLVFPARKPTGGTRVLTIPTLRDRTIGRCAAMFLRQEFDRSLQPQSYAYRPHKGALKAVSAAQKGCASADYAVRVDIQNYFDSINLEILHTLLRELGLGPALVDLLTGLGAPRRFDGTCVDRPERGLAQGSSLSPWLANLYLDPLDRALAERKCPYVRYADDLVMFTGNALDANGCLALVQENLAELRLEAGLDKSRVYRVDEGFLFLGFLFNRQGHIAGAEARCRLRHKLEEPAYDDEREEDHQARLQTVIRGWSNYYGPIPSTAKADAEPASATLPPVEAPRADSTPEPNLRAPTERAPSDLLERADALVHAENWGEAARLLRSRLAMLEEEGSTANAAALRTRLAAVYEAAGMAGAAQRLRGAPVSRRSEDASDTPWGARDVETWLDLFGAGDGPAYRQYVDRLGRSGYRPASHGLNPVYLREHWKGRHTLAVPMFDRGNCVRFAVVDLDMNRALLDHGSQKERNACRETLLDDARGLLDLAQLQGVRGLIEDSGYKGFHVWFFLAGPVQAGLAAGFLKALCRVAGTPREQTHRELFPSSDRPHGDGLLLRVKVPLGVHRVAGRRTCFLGPDGIPLRGGVQALHAGLLNPAGALRGATQAWNRYAQAEKAEPAKSTAEGRDGRFEHLCNRCAVLQALGRKAREERHLCHAERTVLRGILGPLGPEGKSAIHGIMRGCANYSARETDRHIGNVPPRPMGCCRIREILGDFCMQVGCNCRFKPCKNDYAHPLRHLQPVEHKEQPAAVRRAAPKRPQKSHPREGDSVEALLCAFHEQRRELMAIQKQLTERMNGTDMLKLEMGTLSCSGPDPELKTWVVTL